MKPFRRKRTELAIVVWIQLVDFCLSIAAISNLVRFRVVVLRRVSGLRASDTVMVVF